MKQIAIKTFVKDLVVTLLAFILPYLICSIGMDMPQLGFILSIVVGPLPMGWRWGSRLISAVSFNGLVMKCFFCAFLGYIAIPVILIGDIIKIFTAKDSDAETTEAVQ